MKNVFVVELKTHETVFIPLGRYLTHGSIRFYTVGFLTIIIQHYFEVIEVRVVGIPQFRRFHRKQNLASGNRFTTGHNLLAVLEYCFHIGGFRTSGPSLHRQRFLINIGHCCHLLDVLFPDRLHPHRLPDTAYRSVPYEMILNHLFSHGLERSSGRIPYLYHQLLISFILQIRSNIKRERVKSAGMRTDHYIIDVDVRFPIYRLKVQFDIFPFPLGRNGKFPFVPKFLIFIDSFHYS